MPDGGAKDSETGRPAGGSGNRNGKAAAASENRGLRGMREGLPEIQVQKISRRLPGTGKAQAGHVPVPGLPKGLAGLGRRKPARNFTGQNGLFRVNP